MKDKEHHRRKVSSLADPAARPHFLIQFRIFFHPLSFILYPSSFILHPLSFILLCCLPAIALSDRDPRDSASLTPEHRNIANWQNVSEVWMPWPIVRVRHAPDHAQVAIYPLLTITRDDKLQQRNVDVLWPLSSWRSRESAWGVTDRKDFSILPLYYSGGGERDGVIHHNRFLIPFYWQGRQTDGGHYFILFPFIWHARDARLVVPLFPPREQNFSAFWPISGEFRGYWNRDGIRFFLWPLFVKSWRGEGEDRMELLSVVWPITGYYRGDKVKGFRLWPLVSYVDVRDQQRRAYWLFPLGRYHLSRGTGVDGADEKFVLFFPFYGRMRTRNINYDAIFPFFGRLDMAGRRSRGWALGTYMQDDNLRTGIRNHRVLWFLIRWTTRIEVPERFAEASSVGRGFQGGGVFPIYVRRRNPTRELQTVLWPFYHHRVERAEAHEFRRSYLLPVWAFQRRQHQDGTRSSRGFLWPFYRHWRDTDGHRYQSAPHLFPYSRAAAPDRNWAPFWTVWGRRWNENTGESRVRVLGGVWKHDRNIIGDERKRFDLLLFSNESRRPIDVRPERDIHLLFGAIGVHRRQGRTTLSILGGGKPESSGTTYPSLASNPD